MWIPFDNIENARELGGLPGADGRRVKSGLLLRTAKLNAADAGEVARLQGYGVRLIFDLRDAVEFTRRPDVDIPGARLIQLPVLPGLPGDGKEDFRLLTPEKVVEMMRRVYRLLAEDEVCIAAYQTFFREILAAGGEAILWHCNQGKDRTGIAAILLLTALGVDEETAVGEYFLTNEFMSAQLAALEARGMAGLELAVMEKLLLVMPECLDVYLDCVHGRCGTLDAYLREVIGLSEGDIALLRDWYLEESVTLEPMTRDALH